MKAERLLRRFRGEGLGARSLRAGILTLFGFGGQKALQLGSNLILTRILFPEAFGLMALVTVFVLGLTLLSDVGIKPAVIRSSRSEDPRFQSTAWTLQVVRGAVITVIAWMLAWPYALIYDEPLLFPLVAVAALSAFVKGFGSIELVIHERRLALGRIVLVRLVAHSLSVIATIALAWWFQSVWALPLGFVISAVLLTGTSLIWFPSSNHRFTWDHDVLSEILVFGRWVLLATLFGFFGGRGLMAVQGVLIDLETLAFLSIAANLALILTEVIGAVLRSVVFPALSQVVREIPSELTQTVRRVRRLKLLLGLPPCILMSLAAEPLIELLYDQRYLAAGPLLALIALNSGLGIVPMIYQSAFLARGDSRIHANVMGGATVLRICGTVAGFYAGGVTGMLVGFGVATIFTNFLSLFYAWRSGFGAVVTDFSAMGVVLVFYALQLAGMV